MDSLIDLLTFAIKENLNDKYDKLLTKVLRILQYVITNHFFSMSASCCVSAFELGCLCVANSKSIPAKHLCKVVLVLICELTVQRLKLQNFIFSSPNPLSYFYTQSAGKSVAAEATATLQSVIDRVVLNQIGSRYVTNLSKENVMGLDSINFEVDANAEKRNEVKAGPFGWCTVCGGTAYFYCKEARVPICSHECKLRFIETEDAVKAHFNFSRTFEKHELEFNGNFIDVFNALSDKCFNKKYEKDRLFYLNVMSRVFQTSPIIPQTLRKDPRFIGFVKKDLFHNLLRITINAEDATLKTCLLIFLFLLNKFRKYLRVEIGTFIQEIILEILKSPNSKFVVKFYTLQVLTFIIGDKSFALELFLNFDLRENSFSLCQQIIDLLVKIAVGKYEKTIYAGLISSADEEELRVEAGNAMINLIKGASSFLEQSALAEKPVIPKGYSDVLIKKREIDDAISKFNLGKKSGLKMLRELGVVKEGPESLANFLRTDKRVSQSAIGEVFGGEDEFNLKVLESFLNSLNFKDVQVLDALKLFLNLFELPGESQKVERILENFAIKYVKDNPNELTQDAVHLLSFSFMMLHTNIHNPQVLDKMTLQTYLSLGKNIKNNDKPIPPEKLTQFYNNIVAEPLAVHNLERRKREIQSNLQRSYKEKQELFKVETQKLIENYASKVQQFDSESDYHFVEDVSVLQVFLKSSWANFHGFFSNCIAKAGSIEYLRTLVDATITMIRLCDVFDLETERNSFINILVQFSGLEKTFNKSLDEKNELFIHSVMNIATKMGNNLHTGWKLVLGCLITINYYQSQAEKVKQKGVVNQPLTLDEENALFVASNFPPESVNRIFMDTKQLNEQSIRDFLNALCELSLKEIERGGSRVFYILEQVVVVMHFNISRNSLEWIRLWDIIENFCNEIMNRIPKTTNDVIDFAIDIVRQLVLCCFGNQNLLTQKFQQKILGVYVTVTQNKNITPRITEFLAVSLQSVVSRVSTQLDAGISSIFKTLTLCNAVSDGWITKKENKAKEIANLVIGIIDHLFKELDIHMKNMRDEWDIFLGLLTALCKHEDVDTVYTAIKTHEELFNLFWDQSLIGTKYSEFVLSQFRLVSTEENKLSFANENAYFESYNLPALEYLKDFSNRKSDEDYKLVINKLFEFLFKIEKHLNMNSWKEIFSRIFEPLYKTLFAELSKRDSALDLKEIFIFAMNSVFNLSVANKTKSVELVRANHELLYELSKSRFMPFLDQLTINLNQNITEAIKRAENPWIEGIWEEIIEYISRLFNDYLPKELVENEIFSEIETKAHPIDLSSLKADMLPNPHFVAFKCRFVVNFMKLAQIILRNTNLPAKSTEQLFKLIDQSLVLSRKFNNKSLHRFILWKRGYFSNQNSLPSLYIFEVNVYLAKFFHFKKVFSQENWEILATICEILRNYNEKLEATEIALGSLKDLQFKYITNEEHNREYKEKNYLEKQTACILCYDLVIEHISPFLSKLDLQELEGSLSKFDELIEVLIEFLSRANIVYYTHFKCLECLGCKDCDGKFSRLKRCSAIEDFLKILIKARIRRTT